MERIELVVFDLAGTTVDDEKGVVLRCLVEAAEAHELPGSPEELNAMMGMNKREVFGALARNTCSDDPDRLAEAALDTFVTRLRLEYDQSLQPVPGAEETFAFLRQRGVKIATDTGFDTAINEMIMRRLDWPGRLIDLAICSSDVPRGRPAPYMIFRAMEQLGVIDIRRVMKIGDSPADLDEGTNAGCVEVIGVLSGAHSAETLGSFPHTRLLRSVADLPSLFEG